MSKKLFERKVRYTALTITDYPWKLTDPIVLVAENRTNIVAVGMSVQEAKELRKQLKATIARAEAPE